MYEIDGTNSKKILFEYDCGVADPLTCTSCEKNNMYQCF